MNVVNYNDIDKDKWNDFVESSPEAWLYSTSSYIDYAVKEGNVNISFALVTDSGEVQSICPLFLYKDFSPSDNIFLHFIQRAINKILRIIKIPRLFTTNYFSTGYSGIALKNGISRRNKKKNIKEIISVIDMLSIKYKASFCEIRNVDIAPSNDDYISLYTSLFSAGMHVSGHYPVRLFSRIDLSLSEKEIWSGIDEDCRAEINKAKRENVLIEIDPVNSLDRFYDIHCISWDRTMGHHHPKERFINESKVFDNNVHYFIASHSNKDVAAIIIHTFKGAVFYWSGCSLLEGQKVKPNNYLLYSAIMWAKEQGLRWFGVGIFDSSCGHNEKEYKVGQYKAQFSTLHHPVAEFKKFYTKKALSLYQRELYKNLR